MGLLAEALSDEGQETTVVYSNIIVNFVQNERLIFNLSWQKDT